MSPNPGTSGHDMGKVPTRVSLLSKKRKADITRIKYKLNKIVNNGISINAGNVTRRSFNLACKLLIKYEDDVYYSRGLTQNEIKILNNYYLSHISYTYNDIEYRLTNEDLKIGDKVFPVSRGKKEYNKSMEYEYEHI